MPHFVRMIEQLVKGKLKDTDYPFIDPPALSGNQSGASSAGTSTPSGVTGNQNRSVASQNCSISGTSLITHLINSDRRT